MNKQDILNHDRYLCDYIIFYKKDYKDYKCLLCDEQMKIYCLDKNKIKDEIRDYILSIPGVYDVTIGLSDNYNGNDTRKYIIITLCAGYRSKFIRENIEESDYWGFLI